MRGKIREAFWRFGAFVVVALMAMFGLLAIFGQLRFQRETVYKAEFSNITGLKTNDFVRVAGVEVGKVGKIALKPDGTAVVAFGTDPSVVLTEGNRAVVRFDNLIGDRYLALEEGAGGVAKLQPGSTIPVSQTAPALDLDALLGGFKPLFRALDPDQVNALTGQLIAAFQGEGGAIGSFLTQTASVTNTLADRDQLIGQVVNNLNVVLGSLGDQSAQLDKATDSLSQLVSALAARRTAISAGLAHTQQASQTVADLLMRSRDPFKDVVAQTDRAATIAVLDHDYLDNIINTLPDKYKVLGRQGLFGDFFSFYLCDLFLKLNGQGGQPVLVKVAGQNSGRCAPK